MADNFNLIKPLEGLQNMQGLAPTQRRKERKPRQQSYKESQEQPQDELTDDEVDTQKKPDDGHIIDYNA
jgi:hypothetical protein